MKRTVESILKEYGFNSSEFDNVFKAMSDILELAATQLEIDEPYAQISIDSLRKMAIDISDKEQFMEANNLL